MKTDIVTLAGSLICGAIVWIASMLLIRLIRRSDQEIVLPKKLRRQEQILMLIAGCVCFHESVTETLLFMFVVIYAVVMAYIDYYTRQLYTFFSLTVLALTFVFINVRNPAWKENLIALCIYASVILLGRVIKAYYAGDVYMLLAIAPISMEYLSEGERMVEKFLSNLSLLAMILVLSLIARLIYQKKKQSLQGLAMAPCITFGLVLTTYLH